MKISNMAVKNVRGNLYRYIMYCLSNAFAVTAFFIFANFVFHPSIDFNSDGVHAVASMGAANGMKISQVIIIIFSFTDKVSNKLNSWNINPKLFLLNMANSSSFNL